MKVKTDQESTNNCIGDLEHLVHNLFSSVRIPGEDFVYSPQVELFSKLDKYCEESTSQDSKPPLVIKGESGTGKSALLSNWLQWRDRNTSKLRNTTDEYIFWHAVGCSRQSMNVNSLIRRLIVGLKSRFELARDLPKSQERLCWELPRFLDLAAKKARLIIIVIDGLNRIVNNDNIEDGITWLPLIFPSNVRVILSVTISSTFLLKKNINTNNSLCEVNFLNSTIPNNMKNEDVEKPNNSTIEEEVQVNRKKSRILQELERRDLPVIVLKPFEQNVCKVMLESFIVKSVTKDSAMLAAGPFLAGLTAAHEDASVSVDDKSSQLRDDIKSMHGFILFESQINALVNHPLGGVPIFLRFFLCCLQYAMSRGYSLWHVWDDWLLSCSIPDLLERILRTLESGFRFSQDNQKYACDKTALAGGFNALQKQYSWHPSFVNKKNGEATDIPTVHEADDRQRNGRKRTDSMHSNTEHSVRDMLHTSGGTSRSRVMNNSHIQVKSMSRSLSGSIKQSLGDEKWNDVSEQADLKLQQAIKESAQLVEDALSGAKNISVEQQVTFLTELVQNLKDMHHSGATLGISTSTSRYTKDVHGFAIKTNNMFENANDDSSTCSDGKIKIKGNAETEEQSMLSESELAYSLHEELSVDNNRASNFSNERSNTSVNMQNNDQQTFNTSFYENIENESIASSSKSLNNNSRKASRATEENSINKLTKLIEKNKQNYNDYCQTSQVVVEKDEKLNQPIVMGKSFTLVSRPMSPPSPLLTQSKKMSNNAQTEKRNKAVDDPYDRFDMLPQYLKGGISTVGFGDLLGNALALLYVSRQGLREGELWKILSQLQYKKEQDTTSNFISQEMKDANNEIVRQLCANIIESQGSFIDLLKSEDFNVSGYLGFNKVIFCLKKCFPLTKKKDLMKVFEFIESNYVDPTTTVATAVTSMKNATDSNILSEIGGVPNLPLYKDNNLICYEKFLIILNKLNRQYKFSESLKLGVIPGIAGENAGSHLIKTPTMHQKQQKQLQNVKNVVRKTKDSMSASLNLVDNHHENYENFNLKLQTDSTPLKQIPSFKNKQQQQINNSIVSSNNQLNNNTETSEGLIFVSNESEQESYSLGPLIEDSLLTVLIALGVLYSAENKVLILPSDSEPFRKVIYENYISCRGGLFYWHQLIIKYFQNEEVSMRRCEELPWHLKICRKWHALKDTLVDLKTFDLMFNSEHLRDELMNYWLLLTEGPLFIHNEHDKRGVYAMHHHHHHNNENQQQQNGADNDEAISEDSSVNAHLLWEIDLARELNISVAETRKKMFKNQNTPFDIVEEFNKSLETWVQVTHPTPLQMHASINQISNFFAEFSKVTTINPSFLRVGIDFSSMQTFGVSLAEIKNAAFLTNKNSSNNNNSNSHEMSVHDLLFNSPTLKPTTASSSPLRTSQQQQQVSSPSKQQNQQQQITAVSSPVKHQVATLTNAACMSNDEKKKKDVSVRFPTQQMVNSNLYPYLRWIWMQFPWLALHPAATLHVAQNNAAVGSATSQENESNMKNNHNNFNNNNKSKEDIFFDAKKSPLENKNFFNFNDDDDDSHKKNMNGNNNNSSSLPLLGNTMGLFTDLPSNSDNDRLLRLWKVKKSDPSVPVFKNSVYRQLAAVKSRSTSLSKGLECNVDVTFKAIYNEMLQPSHTMLLSTGIGGRDKFHRSFQEEIERTKNIPFGYHTKKTLRCGSLFPTYAKMIEDTNKNKLKEEFEGDAISATNSNNNSNMKTNKKTHHHSHTHHAHHLSQSQSQSQLHLGSNHAKHNKKKNCNRSTFIKS